MNKLVVSLALCAALGIPSITRAQLPVSFGIAGGPTFSQEANEVGYHAGALIDISLPLLPVGFRVDGFINQFDFAGGKTRIFDVTANVVYAPLPTPIAKPYFIGGVGFYSTRITDSPRLGQDDIGVNGGAGVKFNFIALKLFLDARYHHVFGDGEATSFIPVTIGIMF